jgi:hypothetical protein
MYPVSNIANPSCIIKIIHDPKRVHKASIGTSGSNFGITSLGANASRSIQLIACRRSYAVDIMEKEFFISHCAGKHAHVDDKLGSAWGLPLCPAARWWTLRTEWHALANSLAPTATSIDCVGGIQGAGPMAHVACGRRSELGTAADDQTSQQALHGKLAKLGHLEL